MALLRPYYGMQDLNARIHPRELSPSYFSLQAASSSVRVFTEASVGISQRPEKFPPLLNAALLWNSPSSSSSLVYSSTQFKLGLPRTSRHGLVVSEGKQLRSSDVRNGISGSEQKGGCSLIQTAAAVSVQKAEAITSDLDSNKEPLAVKSRAEEFVSSLEGGQAGLDRLLEQLGAKELRLQQLQREIDAFYEETFGDISLPVTTSNQAVDEVQKVEAQAVEPEVRSFTGINEKAWGELGRSEPLILKELIGALERRQWQIFQGRIHDLALIRERVRKLLKPKWAEKMAGQGSGGAFEISQRLTALLGWGGTAGFQEDWVYDQAAATYATDPAMAALLRKNNPQAFRNIVKRMLEAAGRGFWTADEKMVAKLRELFDDIDNELEGMK
eukprot:TRINITY_DN3071_c0_g2_i1.p1 TRINITY_DN3071_c0_g2~~TRINITY_DN3071_c0_g2_i1.p1  ORF type:complete len:386 (+),score=81.60 TRINITY_DN3071_c0_g2_i1:119-1276(+)